MHQEKHARLVQAGHHSAVQIVAVRFGVGVDEVMHAGHGRPHAPAAARSAFAALEPDVRRALQAVPWPFTCPGCQALVEELLSCPCCPAKGCEGCALPGKCSGCRKGEAERRAAEERKGDERRRVEAQRDKSAREATAASERIKASQAKQADG